MPQSSTRSSMHSCHSRQNRSCRPILTSPKEAPIHITHRPLPSSRSFSNSAGGCPRMTNILSMRSNHRQTQLCKQQSMTGRIAMTQYKFVIQTMLLKPLRWQRCMGSICHDFNLFAKAGILTTSWTSLEDSSFNSTSPSATRFCQLFTHLMQYVSLVEPCIWSKMMNRKMFSVRKRLSRGMIGYLCPLDLCANHVIMTIGKTWHGR